jgi:hypothetical protein
MIDDDDWPTGDCPWLSTNGAILIPKTPQELWQTIGNLSFGMGEGTKFVWRGLPDFRFSVEASLLRDFRLQGVEITEENVRRHELELLREARDWGLGRTAFGHATDLHILSTLQHHGVHTRLVDVTYNPMTALWFACGYMTDIPGTLVAMAVTNPQVCRTSTRLEHTWDSVGSPYSSDYDVALKASTEKDDVFLVEPDVRDARMTAQEGFFLTSAIPLGPSSPALIGLPRPKMDGFFGQVSNLVNAGLPVNVGEAWGPFAAAGIIITPNVKRATLSVLETSFNRNHRTMFPDLAGFVQKQQNRIFVDDCWSYSASSSSQSVG